MKVLIDLFCGAGGYSEGADLAGFDKIIGVDFWENALKIHEQNLPESICLHMKLGGDQKKTFDKIMSVAKIRKGDVVHCHASPPCQNLSSVNNQKDEEIGMSLVKWSLSFLKRYFKHSWTIEQVYNKTLVQYLNDSNVFWRRIDMSKFGIPQKRIRVIACNKDVFDKIPQSTMLMSQVVTAPPGTYYLGGSRCSQRCLLIPERNMEHQKRYIPDETMSFCVLCRQMYWISEDRRVIRSFTVDERATIQTFRKSSRENFEKWYLKQEARVMIANSVPPKFAKVLLETILSC